MRAILSGVFEVIQNASLIGIACLWLGWVRSDFDRRRDFIRNLSWGIAFATLAIVSMLAPAEPIPGLRIDNRAAMVALAAIFGGPPAAAVVAVVEAAVRFWVGGPLALTAMIGIGLSFFVSALFVRLLPSGPMDRKPISLAMLGLLTGIAGPAASFATSNPSVAWNLISVGAPPQVIAVTMSVVVFAIVILRADSARRNIEEIRRREADLSEANQQLTELAVRLEQKSQEYVETLNREEGLKAQMAAIFHNSPFGIFIKNIDGRYTMLNAAATRALDRPAEELVGRRAAEFMSPANAEVSLRSDHEVLVDGKTVSLEYESLSAEAPEWLWTLKFPIRNALAEIVGIGGFDIDISTRKRQEVALQRTALLLRRVRQITRIIYWYHHFDPKAGYTRIEDAPDDLFEMTGWRAKDILDRTVYLEKCVHPLDRERMREIYSAFAAGKIDGYTAEYKLICADDRIIPMKVWVERLPVSGGGDANFVIGAMQDVSDQHEREAKLADALAKAEMADRVKTEFLANLSHELRTPLNAVIGFSDLLQLQYASSGEVRTLEYLAMINRSGLSLLGIINDLLDIVRLDFGALDRTESTFNAGEAVRETITRVEARFRDKAHEFLYDEASPNLLVRAEEHYFRQALNNVLDNAAKFTEARGRIAIEIARSENGALEIAVQDSGCGIAAELLPLLAAPFVFAESVYAKRHGGVGLGLAMCKKILDLHGGQMTVESTPGQGTRVVLVYPPERAVSPDAR